MAFPRTWEGQEIERVTVDEEQISTSDLVTTGTSYERIIELGAGRHTISVFYREPPVTEENRDGEKEDASDK